MTTIVTSTQEKFKTMALTLMIWSVELSDQYGATNSQVLSYQLWKEFTINLKQLLIWIFSYFTI